jgi:hypothetical protein
VRRASAPAARRAGRGATARGAPRGDATSRALRGSRAVVDGWPALVLPLVHHLVQQRVQRLLPAVAADVVAADHDLRDVARHGDAAV